MEAGPPAGRLPSTPAALLVALDDAGAPAGLTVLSVAADGRGGTAVVVPLGTAAYLDGLAKPVRVDSAFKDGGLDAQTRAVESVLGISTTTSQAVNEDQVASLLAPYTPVEVTFDTPVLETASNGATREVLSAGEHRLTAREAAQVLLASVDGESELARLPRQQAVWTALLDRADSASAASTTTPTSAGTPADAPSDVAGFLAAATSGPVGVHALRVQPSFDPSAPSGPELLQADVGYLRLLVATVMPGAVSPSNGNISFRIVNPLGSTGGRVPGGGPAVCRAGQRRPRHRCARPGTRAHDDRLPVTSRGDAGGHVRARARGRHADGERRADRRHRRHRHPRPGLPGVPRCRGGQDRGDHDGGAADDRGAEHVDRQADDGDHDQAHDAHDDQEGQRLSIRHDDTHETDRSTGDPGRAWALVAARTADDKQGRGTVVLDVGSVLAITDYFVVTSGRNSRQVRTIAEEIERAIKETGGPGPLRVEGLSDLTWVLLDYGDLVVHVFDEETRRFYDIERLYRDVPVIDWGAVERHRADRAGVTRY